MNSTTSFGDMYCESNTTISCDNGAYNYYHDSNSVMDQDIQEDYCGMDDDYYQSYDAQMADIVAEADYQDYYYGYNHQAQEEYIEEDEYDCYDNDPQSGYYQPEKTEYDYKTDSLLSLVVGVQSYLSEQANSNNALKCDSPLYSLQYKMYTYMRQRALELGVQF